MEWFVLRYPNPDIHELLIMRSPTSFAEAFSMRRMVEVLTFEAQTDKLADVKAAFELKAGQSGLDTEEQKVIFPEDLE
jgi:hypothetical protein